MKSKSTLVWVAALGVAILVPVGLFFALKALFSSGLASLNAFGSMDELMAKQVHEARDSLATAKTDSEKCFPMAMIAKDDFNRGNIAEARKYGAELLAISHRLKGLDLYEPDRGIAIHDGNMVLGRIALKDHHLKEAKQYLLDAGMTPGAPTLNSFGPNMSLAKDLLAVGERATVIAYFHECRRFWGFKADKLKEWEEEVKRGNTPDFESNLYY